MYNMVNIIYKAKADPRELTTRLAFSSPLSTPVAVFFFT